MLTVAFLLIVLCRVNGNLALRSVNRNIGGFSKGWPFLNVAITDKPKGTTLRKHRRFVIDRTILKAEHQVGDHTISARDLDKVSSGYDLAIHRSQNEEPVFSTLFVAGGYRFSKQPGRLHQKQQQ